MLRRLECRQELLKGIILIQNNNKEKIFNIVRPVFPKLEDFSGEFIEALSSGNVTNQSKYVIEFERRLADYIGVKYCAVFNNGEQALIAMIHSGKLTGEVITPAYTFCGTTHALIWNNLFPVFVDIDEETWTIDVSKVEEKITPRTSAILAAPLYGNPCNNYELEKIARKNNLKLFYDSASACGSVFDSKKVGSFGDAEIFSFHATKVMTTMEGGAVVTNDKQIYDHVCSLRNFGKNYRDADCDYAGFNGKMTEICALVGLKLIDKLDQFVVHRTSVALEYEKVLSVLPGIKFQKAQKNSVSCWLYFQFEIDESITGFSRDILVDKLNQAGIQARKFLFPANHQLSCYNHLPQTQLPITERVAKNSVALPIYSDMEIEEVQFISNKVLEVSNSIRKRKEIVK